MNAKMSAAKRAELINTPLHEILQNNGYRIKKDKSSKNQKVMTNDSGDTIVVSRYANGNYVYFNPNESDDRGNIFNFAKNRGITPQVLLKGIAISDSANHIAPKGESDGNLKQILADFKAANSLDLNNNALSGKRGLNAKLLSQFPNIKQSKYQNILIPTYKLKSIDVSKISANKTAITQIGQVGYISYLATPLTKDKNGNPYEKPIKQLCYGQKGLEMLRTADGADLKDIKTIVIAESTIDSLSFAQIKKLDLKTSLLCSTNGQICQASKEIVKYLAKHAKEAEFILGFDNDEKGRAFGEQMKQIVPNAKIETPFLKDFNDDLIIKNTLQIYGDLTGEKIKGVFNATESKIEHLSKRMDIIYPSERERQIKELYGKDLPALNKAIEKMGSIGGIGGDFERLDGKAKALSKQIENFNHRGR